MSWINDTIKALWFWLLSPLALLTAVLGSALLLTASPLIWPKLYTAPADVSIHAQEDGETIAKNLWTTTPYKEVSRSLKGRRLINDEIHHYDDLQIKFRELKNLVIITSLIAAIALYSRKRLPVTYLSLAWLVLLSLIGTLWALIAWRHFFQTLHWWIFQDDSWLLPWGCYSLDIFPYLVWKKSMVFMVGYSLLVYICIIASSQRIQSRKKRKDAQRSCEDA